MSKFQLDAIDRLILTELTDNARIPFTELAKKLRVSNTLVHQRYKRLRETGVLQNATFKLNPLSLGYETTAFTQVMLTDSKHHRSVEEALSKIPEIVQCVNISGRYALLVVIYTRNNRHLRDVIYEGIHPIKGVEGTNTTIAFETAFSRNVPLGEA